MNAIPQLLSGPGSSPLGDIGSSPLSATIARPILAFPKASDFSDEMLKKIFWHRSTWTSHVNALKGSTIPNSNAKKTKGKTRAAEGENVAMLYVVNKDGIAVDGYRASEMRKVARTIWIQLRSAGVFPNRWITDAPLSASEGFRHEMQKRFEELQLCENGWKVDQIAIDYYPSWRNGVLKKKDVIEIDDDDEDNDDSSDVPQNLHKRKLKSTESQAKSKRPRPTPTAAEPKKMPADEVDDMPVPCTLVDPLQVSLYFTVQRLTKFSEPILQSQMPLVMKTPSE